MRGARSVTRSLGGSGLGSHNRTVRATASAFKFQKHLRSLGFAERHTVQVLKGGDELPIYLTRVFTCRLGLTE